MKASLNSWVILLIKMVEHLKGLSRKATPEERAKIQCIRDNLNLKPGKQNVAYLEGTINGKLINIESVSGQKSPQGSVETTPFEEQQLKTQPTRADIEKGQTIADRRAYDSEVKGLEKVLKETTPEAKGIIKVVSERDLCGSCSNAVEQFRNLRPNIKVETVYSKPYSSPL